MSIQQWIIFGALLLTLVLFITGRWRYDVVALLALLIVALTGLIPVERAFSGFSNPAVITVAAVPVISRGRQNSGAVDLIGEGLLRLIPNVYDGQSLSAAGVAAHEAGHAIQHKLAYAPLQLRSMMAPTVQVGSWIGPIIFIVGFLMPSALGTTLA